MVFASPSSVFPQSFQYQYWKAGEYSILAVTELGLPVSETSARISKFDAPTESEYKFNKRKSKIDYP